MLAKWEKHVIMIYNKEKKKGEHKQKLHIGGKSETESQIYTVQ
jgi:hypothetical protein